MAESVPGGAGAQCRGGRDCRPAGGHPHYGAVMSEPSVFESLVVVELASVLAGPAVGMFFAELGSRVIKVENSATRGDVTRSWRGPVEDRGGSE